VDKEGTRSQAAKDKLNSGMKNIWKACMEKETWNGLREYLTEISAEWAPKGGGSAPGAVSSAAPTKKAYGSKFGGGDRYYGRQPQMHWPAAAPYPAITQPQPHQAPANTGWMAVHAPPHQQQQQLVVPQQQHAQPPVVPYANRFDHLPCCTHCGGRTHNESKCFIKHPNLRPKGP